MSKNRYSGPVPLVDGGEEVWASKSPSYDDVTDAGRYPSARKRYWWFSPSISRKPRLIEVWVHPLSWPAWGAHCRDIDTTIGPAEEIGGYWCPWQATG